MAWLTLYRFAAVRCSPRRSLCAAAMPFRPAADTAPPGAQELKVFGYPAGPSAGAILCHRWLAVPTCLRQTKARGI